MLVVLIVLQAITLIALLFVVLRRPASASTSAPDPQLQQLVSANLPAQFTRLDATFNSLNQHLRAELAQLRTDSSSTGATLRTELVGNFTTLGESLRQGIEGSRAENAAAADRLSAKVQEGLKSLNERNEVKLEQMRKTVDEKLEATLHTRLTQSFGQVTTHLGEVQKGLGEMKELAVGVGDLKKVLSNVKSRGIVGEFFLGQLLEQMFSPDQYEANVRIRPGTLESVEYALKVPNGADSTLYLALDSKFPLGDWERLEDAYETGTDDDRKKAGLAFERAIRAQAKLICEKYIDPETTLPFAIMYLPTAALCAEVMRRPGLHAEVQSQYKVVIAGPSDISMMLTSFQMVYRTLKFQKNLAEIWKVFQVAQTEFEKFGGLMEKVENQVGTVQKTLKEIGGKSRTVARAFKNASRLELGSSEISPAAGSQAAFDGLLPALAASEDDE